MNKTKNDDIRFEQYFTKPEVAKDIIQLILNDLQKNLKILIDIFDSDKLHFIEPACGEGVFVKELQKVNKKFQVTALDICDIYNSAIVYDFFKVNADILNIKSNKITVFFGCPPSDLTKEFIQHCKTLSKISIIYFLLEENKLRECVANKSIVSIKIFKNYEYNAFIFQKKDYTTKGAYLLTRVIFEPNLCKRLAQSVRKNLSDSPFQSLE